jgi:hypothetical protein
MEIRRRSTPNPLTFAALSLLAVATFTDLIHRPVAGTIIQPPEVDSPIQRGRPDLNT